MTEAKIHLYALATVVVGLELLLMFWNNPLELKRGSFVLQVMLLFFLFCLLERIIRLFIDSRFAPLLSILPGLLIFFRLKDIEDWSILAWAALVALVIRLFFSFVPFKSKVLVFGCFPLDALTIFLWCAYDCFIGNYLSDKLLLIALIALTLAALQQLVYERGQSSFPFHFFMVLAIVIVFIPVRLTPINWAPVQDVFVKVADSSKSAYYFLENVFKSNTYSTGYGSFNVTGGKVERSDKPQLILTTSEKPYFVYTDEDSHSKRKIRRNIYLAGGKGVDGRQLVAFLQFLHSHYIDRNTASLFSQISKLNIEYVYLNTPDEIAPAGVITMSDGEQSFTEGVSDRAHKKGYKLETIYLDIDYGSQYLIDMICDDTSVNNQSPLSYKDAASYMFSLYSVDLREIISQEEYDEYAFAIWNNGDVNSYLDAGNASERMTKLANEITSAASTDFDKCKQIETYLRQYTYNTDATGGHDANSTIATPDGMADIADRFLFETNEGYCVHYTASMVMLLRLSGIPARASMGYRYAFPFDQQDSYLVTGACAHVWPEAYIKNIGWVPFEPTSAYSTAEAYTWHRTIEETAISSSKSSHQVSHYVPSIPEVSVSSVSDDTVVVSGLQLLKIFGLVLVSILILLGIIILGSISFRKLRYHFAPPEQKLKMDVDMIKGTLSKKFSEKIPDRGLLFDYLTIAPEELKPDLKKTFDMYYRMVYGTKTGGAISADDSAFTKDVRDRLKKCF